MAFGSVLGLLLTQVLQCVVGGPAAKTFLPVPVGYVSDSTRLAMPLLSNAIENVSSTLFTTGADQGTIETRMRLDAQ
jgi:hypothetical protein